MVEKLVNFVRTRGLNHRKFIQLLEDNTKDSEYGVLIYHSNVCWLSHGKVLKLAWDLREEMSTFLGTLGKTQDFPELCDERWLYDFTFTVDILSHLNDFIE